MTRRQNPGEYLFDTQTLILWAKDEVPRKVLTRIHDNSRIAVSIVSLWEFVLKSRYHDLGLTFTDMQQLLEALRAEMLPIKFSHLSRLQGLPFTGDHRDPYDRLLIAQAIDEGLTLVGGDRRFSEYPKLKLLWA